jgi:sporadic carbohydrate cluster protein (TIGR04323 family)
MKTSSSEPVAITGYVTPQQFGPFIMPVPAQNSCLREYALQMNFSYKMPQCEHIFPRCFMQLFTTLTSAELNSHIAMYSFHMMPKDDQKMKEILAIQKQKSLTFHYVLEKKIARTPDDLKEMSKVLHIADMIKDNDTRRQELRKFL